MALNAMRNDVAEYIEDVLANIRQSIVDDNGFPAESFEYLDEPEALVARRGFLSGTVVA